MPAAMVSRRSHALTGTPAGVLPLAASLPGRAFITETDMSKDGKKSGGQKIKTSFPPDHSSHKVKGGKGEKMGGSTSNLDHSLKGSSAVQRGKRY
jgi:hypothetical protein